MSVQFVTFCVGLFLLIISIFGGGIELKEVRVANLNPLSRFLSFMLGCSLLLIYFFAPNYLTTAEIEIEPDRVTERHPTPANNSTNRPSETDPSEEPAASNSASASTQTKGADESLVQANLELQAAKEREKQLKEALDLAVAAARNAQYQAEQATRLAQTSAGREADAQAAQERAEKAQKDAEAAREQVQADLAALSQARKEALEKKRTADVLQANAAGDTSDGTVQAANRLPVIGYVMFAVIDKKNRPRKVFFSIEGKPDAQFPGPNDIISPVITATRDKIALRREPFRWDPSRNRYTLPGEAIAHLRQGQKVVAAGDVSITTDPKNGEQYAIAPIAKASNFDFIIAGQPAVPLQHDNPHVAGYVYVGMIDDESGDFVRRRFENETRPNAIYPAPNDRLRAKTNSILRSGPRYWDAAKGEYVNPPKVGEIREGDIIIIGGDTVLAKEGQSVWAAVAK